MSSMVGWIIHGSKADGDRGACEGWGERDRKVGINSMGK